MARLLPGGVQPLRASTVHPSHYITHVTPYLSLLSFQVALRLGTRKTRRCTRFQVLIVLFMSALRTLPFSTQYLVCSFSGFT